MPTNFERPTPAQLIARAQTDIESEVAGVSAQVRRRPEYAHARAIAGTAHGLHGHLAWVAEQIIVDQASEKFVLRWADFFGLIRKAPVAATGTITVTGSGGTLPAGALWIRVADGLTFATDDEHNAVTSAAVAITAAEGFEGKAGNLTAGTVLQLVSSIAGINGTATVVSLSGGSDVESIDDLRERLVLRVQRPPLGGAPGDHATWALEVPGVYKVWEYAGRDGIGNPGIGKVAVTFVLEPDDDGNVQLPNPTQVADVQQYLDDRSPAQVIVFALEPVPLVTQIDLGENDTTAIRDAVKAELKAMLARDAEPGGTVFLSRINEAISVAAGEYSHDLITPSANVTVPFGHISTYVDPSWS